MTHCRNICDKVFQNSLVHEKVMVRKDFYLLMIHLWCGLDHGARDLDFDTSSHQLFQNSP
jgi:hypothetical protein